MEAVVKREIRPRLRSLLRRVRLYVVFAGLARVAAVAAVCFVLQFCLDYYFRLRVDLRATWLVAVLGLLAWQAWLMLIQPLRVRLRLSDAAALVEDRYPHLKSGLISAVQYAEGEFGGSDRNSPALLDHMLMQAEIQAADLPHKIILNHRRAAMHCGLLAGLALLVVLQAVLSGEALGVWFERNILLREARYRQHTYLRLANDEDGDGILHWPRGDDLPVRVLVTGRPPQDVRLELQFDAGGHEEHLMAAFGDDEFRFTIPRLSEGVELWADGADGRTEVVRVELVERPRMDDAVVIVHPPAYTRESAGALRAGLAVIEVLAGSEVEIAFTTNRPLEQAILLRDRARVGEAILDGERYVARFRPEVNAVYSFELTDLTDLGSVRPRHFPVRVVPDAPPTVVLSVQGASDVVTPQAVLPVLLNLKDRYGLASAELLVTVGDDGVEHRLPLEDLIVGVPQFVISREVSLPDFKVDVDSRVVLSAEATDQNDVTGPGRSQAARHSFRVVSPEELLAEMARREHEFRQEFERIIELQEELRNELLSAALIFQRGAGREMDSSSSVLLQRRQVQLGQQVGQVAGQFERLFEELKVNRQADEQAEERLGRGIVAPLRALVSGPVPQAAELIGRLSAPSQELFAINDRQQDLVLAEMRRVLGNMSRWEGIQETISLLQTIIKMQKELREETDSALDRELEEIFKRPPP